MQLLFIDSDQNAARELYGEFLSYRGMHWDLVHCQDRQQAAKWIDENEFQVVLYRSQEDVDCIRGDLGELLNMVAATPIVSVLEERSEALHVDLIRDGIHDSLIRSKITGLSLMRRLRMAEVRRGAWQRLAAAIDDVEAIQLSQPDQERQLRETVPELTQSLLEELKTDRTPGIRLPCPIRIAYVAPTFGPLTSRPEQAQWESCQLEFIHFVSLRDCVDELASSLNRFHAIVLENSIFEDEHARQLRDLEVLLRYLPTTVLTIEKSDFAALSYVERGFADCLVHEHLSHETLVQSLVQSIARHRRQLAISLNELTVGEKVSDRRKKLRAGNNRRQQVRYLLTLPLLAIPMLPNGTPDRDYVCDAESIDVSLGGMALAIPNQNRIINRNWVVGVKQPSGELHYVSAFLRRISDEGPDLKLGVVFQQDADDFLRLENLTPELDSISNQFVYRTPENILRQWEELGVFRSRLLRRAKCCPECDAVAVVGSGCNQCGSFDFHYQQLIHHFACAFVGAAADFQRDGPFRCPKCLQSELVVGADFEVINSRYDCPDCTHEGTELAQVGSCLKCQLRFPLNVAKEIEVNSYDVDRLDILALVNSAR